MTGCKLGYFLDPGMALMQDGVIGCVNNLEERPLRLSASAGGQELKRQPAADPMQTGPWSMQSARTCPHARSVSPGVKHISLLS